MGQITGFDAYEIAWDNVSGKLGEVLWFNLKLLALSVFVGFLAFYVLQLLGGAILFSVLAILLAYVFGLRPVWEAACLLRFGTVETQDQWISGRLLLFTRAVLCHAILLILKLAAYLAFILPGIYVSCRFCLYLPCLARDPNLSFLGGLMASWRLTRGKVIRMYPFWIVSSVVTPLSGIPVIERPVIALAKEVMHDSLRDSASHS